MGSVLPVVRLTFRDGTLFDVPRHAVVCRMLGVDGPVDGDREYVRLMGSVDAMDEFFWFIRICPDFLGHFVCVSKVRKPSLAQSRLVEASEALFGGSDGWRRFVEKSFLGGHYDISFEFVDLKSDW